MMNKFLVTAVAAAAVALAGCSAGGSDSPAGGGGGGSGSTRVSGPLDPLQSAISDQLLGQLETAAAGTPLAPVLACADLTINQNTLDIVDSVLLGLQNPASLSSTTPEQVEGQVMQLTSNLGALLTALSGGSCSSSGGLPTTNPLAGTPLAPLGDALLPVLQQVQDQLAGGGGGGGGGGSGFASLAALVGQINTALQTGIAQLPPEATSAPVLGGIFGTLTTTLSDVQSLLVAVALDNGGGASTAVENTLDHLLVNVLTQIIPAEFIETQAGQPGVITGPIEDAAATFSSNAADAISQGTTPLINALNGEQLAPVIDPVVNTLLPQIIDPITVALSGGGGGGGDGGPTGTPLDAVLAPLADALTGLLGGAGGGGSTCAFADIPVLNALCTLIP